MDIIIKEIKAYCNNPEAIEKYLLENSATYKGIDHQIDTYFNVPNGRLKLRQGTIESNLIQYNRIEVKDVKKSEVKLFQVVQNHTDLYEVLKTALDVKTVVDKKRKIFFIGNVKFHIDEVAKLGSFVEIEAIGEKGVSDEQELQRQCDYYIKALKINKDDFIDASYSDLIKNN